MKMEKVRKELKRWLLNNGDNNIHRRINNRQIGYEGHLLILGNDIDRVSQLRTRNEIGSLKQLAKNLYIKQGLNHFKRAYNHFYKK